MGGTTTNVLSGDLNDNETVRWLHDRYIEELLSFVDGRVAESYQRRIDAEGIAETSIRQTIDRLQKDSKYARTSPVFRGLLYQIARREIANQVRLHSAEGRDTSRETSLDASPGEVVVESRALTPEEKASIREEMRKGLAALLQERNLVRTLINLFGICLDLNAADIADILKQLPEQPRVPTLPTIRAQIERARERLLQIQHDAREGA